MQTVGWWKTGWFCGCFRTSWWTKSALWAILVQLLLGPAILETLYRDFDPAPCQNWGFWSLYRCYCHGCRECCGWVGLETKVLNSSWFRSAHYPHVGFSSNSPHHGASIQQVHDCLVLSVTGRVDMQITFSSSWCFRRCNVKPDSRNSSVSSNCSFPGPIPENHVWSS